MNCENCKERKATHRNYAMELCKQCDEKISYQMDGIRHTQRINERLYGNTDGLIDKRVYWKGENAKKWGKE